MLVRAILSFAVRVAPEPAPIRETLLAFGDAVRRVVNWCIENKIYNLARVHYALYYNFRERLPDRLCVDAVRQGIWVAKSWIKNPRHGRRLRCPSCGIEGDRDHFASLNLKMKALSGGLDRPQPNANPSRNEGEAGKLSFKSSDSLSSNKPDRHVMSFPRHSRTLKTPKK